MSCDIAIVRIDRPARESFNFVSAARNLSLWSFGTWSVDIDETGLIQGRSIKDGSSIFVRIVPYPEQLLIDFMIGNEADSLTPRIYIRILPGSAMGSHDDECALMMTALRADGMDDQRWADLKAAHAFEVSLLKSAIETGYDHRNV